MVKEVTGYLAKDGTFCPNIKECYFHDIMNDYNEYQKIGLHEVPNYNAIIQVAFEFPNILAVILQNNLENLQINPAPSVLDDEIMEHHRLLIAKLIHKYYGPIETEEIPL